MQLEPECVCAALLTTQAERPRAAETTHAPDDLKHTAASRENLRGLPCPPEDSSLSSCSSQLLTEFLHQATAALSFLTG